MKNVIERTNRFYIEMSRKILSEKEYDILGKLLIQNMTFEQVADAEGITREYVRQIYERTFRKVKSVTELLGEIDVYKDKLKELKQDFKNQGSQSRKRKSKIEPELKKTLNSSHFPFSKRMYSFFEASDIHTIGQLAEIPIKDFHRFRGFKEQCKKELISFIEFENIEHLFAGFAAWKTTPIE
jgi:hypothetical protein